VIRSAGSWDFAPADADGPEGFAQQTVFFEDD
jgi:hypothetical protein